MSLFVLDASTVLTWCFPDEQAEKARAISERIAGGGSVIVPAFWRHEILNALLVGERRKRITSALIQLLNHLPVATDDQATREVVFGTTHLEIAMRGRDALATTDRDMERAALAEGVHVL